MDDFLPLTADLRPNSETTLAPQGGRPSNGAFPFMNFQRQGCGMVLAIGWSGQWAAKFARGEDSLRLAAGMEQTHLRLHPGEKIRTPRILLLPWEGEDPTTGTNRLRRLLMAHYLPRIDGQLVMPPTAQCLQAYFYLTGKASEAFEMTALPRTAAIGAEAYWIDACWYGDRGEWWEELGHQQGQVSQRAEAHQRRRPQGRDEVRPLVRARARAAEVVAGPRASRVLAPQ